MIDIVNSVQQFAPTLYSVDNSRYLESQKYMLEKIDESNLAAQNAATQLASAIGALDFNESERWYKDKLLNDYDAMINGALDKYSGNLRLAMNDIADKSRELSTSPDVLGRVQTNEQYKEWKQGIEKRQDISQDVKDYIIEKNPYHFELQTAEVKDENGNPVLDEKGEPVTKVIGYKDFEEAEPVTQYTNEDINKRIISILNPQTTASGSYQFYTLDENGNSVRTDDFLNAAYYITRDNKRVELSSDKILSAIKQTISDPSIASSLEQDYKVTANKYKNNTIDNPIVLNGSNYISDGDILYNPSGIALTEREYMLERFSELTKTYGYSNRISDTQLHSLITKTDNNNNNNDKNKGGGGENDKTDTSLSNTTTGYAAVQGETRSSHQDYTTGMFTTQQLYNSLIKYSLNDSVPYRPTSSSAFRRNIFGNNNYRYGDDTPLGELLFNSYYSIISPYDGGDKIIRTSAGDNIWQNNEFNRKYGHLLDVNHYINN